MLNILVLNKIYFSSVSIKTDVIQIKYLGQDTILKKKNYLSIDI